MYQADNKNTVHKQMQVGLDIVIISLIHNDIIEISSGSRGFE